MQKTLLTGYLVEGAESVQDLENALYAVKDAAQKTASVSYHKLVSWQAERIADEIALGCYSKPEGKSILEIAVNEVQRRISYAGQNAHHTQFNLCMTAQILIGQNDGKEAVYLKVDTLNALYFKSLDKLKFLTRYDITEADLEAKKAKAAFWESVRGKYEDDIPLCCSVVNFNLLALDPGKLKFRPVPQRAHDIAEERIMNHLLSCYGCQQEIPPAKLMEYVMMARERITYEDMAQAVDTEAEALSGILPELTEERVLQKGA